MQGKIGKWETDKRIQWLGFWKKAILLFLIFIPCAVFSQNVRTLTGRLADTRGQRIEGAIIVLMNKADSTQICWDYFPTDAFRMEYECQEEVALLLYVSAIGYNGKYVEVDGSQEEQGTVILEPLSVTLEEATVAARQPIKHTYENGKDVYEIPKWIREREYDLNSLLSRLPGLIENGGIQIAGIGSPAYLINGLAPLGGVNCRI